ncbi:hypothetical protein KFL_003410020 [Klebsormidium nitens]|uniref:Uncharacterized protein n=1 Tax=Klebsormidium nitens TaxID=105231 RepID=A0A1Y1I8D5_KLENI|nr:hypothetical protein KFL_003410020 [Klebsormidium nitens]|eukprot:GAQ87245.1 hypothetical protein KFL_003410020 [Klebsormidium nitens]
MMRSNRLTVSTSVSPSDILNPKNYPDFDARAERDVGSFVSKLCALRRCFVTYTSPADLLGFGNMNRWHEYANLYLLVPEGSFQVESTEQPLKPGDLQRMIEGAQQGGAWAFRGSDNDGWVILFDDLGEPLVLHTHSEPSKESAEVGNNEDSGNAGTVNVEAVFRAFEEVSSNPAMWDPSTRSLFVYITDKTAAYDAYVTLSERARDVILIDARRHRAFYGHQEEGSLMHSFKVLEDLARDWHTFGSPPPPPPHFPIGDHLE